MLFFPDFYIIFLISLLKFALQIALCPEEGSVYLQVLIFQTKDLGLHIADLFIA